MTGLVIDQVSVARGGHTVVREVSITAPLGEVTAILGPNGAGKSSLALGVAGLLRTTHGTVSIDGVDVTHRRPDKVRAAGISVVPEGRKLLPELSVADNLQVSTYALSKNDSQAGIDYAISLFPELEMRYNQLGSTLSGGQQQMLVLAQGLVSHPKVLLVDEMSLGLAPIVIKRLIPTIESIAAAGVGVLLIEQFAHVALGLATTAYVMESARIRYSGTAQELTENPDLLHSAYLFASELMQELGGKVAVVTGAASGIGLGMAQRFAAEGMRVVMADVERNTLQSAVDELSATGAEVIAAPTDTSVFEEVESLAARALDRFGAVHVLCNNAGVGSRGLPFRELPLRDFEWVLGVNLWGVIHGLHAFLPHLRLQDEGHIVNTASVSAVYHLPNMAPYNASKAAVLALSETLKFELDAEGSHVGVSVLCPSWVRTNISTASRNLPERLAYELTTEQMTQIAEYKGRRKQQLVTAMEPDEVADQVCDAIRTNRFYVITHPASIANMRERFDRIVTGENPIEPTQ